MGVNLRELLLKHKITFEELRSKKIAIDAFNSLYQFLATIRQADGKPLIDSSGNITSHLSGLFYRTINLIEAGIKPVFVFDGKAPEEKIATQEAREIIREEARIKYAEALKRGELEEARKFAQQTSRLTREMVQESKELLTAMGLPWVQAIAEGEAQAAYMCLKGEVWAVASQDYDSLLFAAPRLIRNLTISGKRKLNEKIVDIDIELIDLAECLNYLGIDIERLVELALLIGTDYNPGGVQGIGPKTALKIIREGKFSDYADKIPNYQRLKQLFLKPIVTSDYALEWKSPNEEKIKQILVERHEFSADRVDSALKRIKKTSGQAGLSDFVD
ncbi:MAG: flap endonuclease-1 [Candidatus Nanoarchaeia archaeon]